MVLCKRQMKNSFEGDWNQHGETLKSAHLLWRDGATSILYTELVLFLTFAFNFVSINKYLLRLRPIFRVSGEEEEVYKLHVLH